MSAKRILVVDDNDPIRLLSAAALTLAGYAVESSPDGLDALSKLRLSDYDLVVADIEMPGIDGITLYTHAVNEFPYLKTRFLFITGNISTDRLSSVKQLKRRYLAKPFLMAELVEQVKRLLKA